MNAGRVQDFPDDDILRGVDDDGLRGVTDVEAVGRRIDGEIVPASLAADWNLLDETVGTVLRVDAERSQTDGRVSTVQQNRSRSH